MKPSTPWITYRTRFLVKAKQLTTSLTFIDLLGRPQSGRKGDYLVESSEGVLSIAPRQIFEDIYISLHPCVATAHEETPQPIRRPPETPPLPPPPPLTRKSPQPDRDRRPPSQGLRSL